MTTQKRLNLVERAINEIEKAAHMDRWLLDQHAHWNQSPVDPRYSAALQILKEKRAEIVNNNGAQGRI